MRHAVAPGERVARGTGDLVDAEHGVGVVGGVCAEAHVDVEEGGGVAGVPAGDDGELAAGYGPAGAVLGDGETAAWGLLVNDRRMKLGEEYIQGYCHCISSRRVLPRHGGYSMEKWAEVRGREVRRKRRVVKRAVTPREACCRELDVESIVMMLCMEDVVMVMEFGGEVE